MLSDETPQNKAFSLAIVLIVGLDIYPRHFAVNVGPKIENGPVLAVASNSFATNMYKISKEYKTIEKLKDHAFDENHINDITSICGNGTLNIFVTTSRDSTAKIWDALDNSLMREVQFHEVAWSAGFANERGDFFVGLDLDLVLIRVQDYLPYNPMRYLLDFDFTDDLADISLQFDPSLDFWEYYRPGLEEKGDLKWHVAKKINVLPKIEKPKRSHKEQEMQRRAHQQRQQRDEYLRKEKERYNNARPFENVTLFTETAMNGDGDEGIQSRDSESASDDKDDEQNHRGRRRPSQYSEDDLVGSFGTSSAIRRQMQAARKKKSRRKSSVARSAFKRRENFVFLEEDDDPVDDTVIPEYVPPKRLKGKKVNDPGTKKQKRVLRPKYALRSDDAQQSSDESEEDESEEEVNEELDGQLAKIGKELAETWQEEFEANQNKRNINEKAKGIMSQRLVDRIKKTKQKMHMDQVQEELEEYVPSSFIPTGLECPPSTPDPDEIIEGDYIKSTKALFIPADTFLKHEEDGTKHVKLRNRSSAGGIASATSKVKKARAGKKAPEKTKKGKTDYYIPAPENPAVHAEYEAPKLDYETYKAGAKKKLKHIRKGREQIEQIEVEQEEIELEVMRRDAETNEKWDPKSGSRITKREVKRSQDDEKYEINQIKANPYKGSEYQQPQRSHKKGTKPREETISAPSPFGKLKEESFPILPAIGPGPGGRKTSHAYHQTEALVVPKIPRKLSEADLKRIEFDKKAWSIIQGAFAGQKEEEEEIFAPTVLKKKTDALKLQEELNDLNERSWFPRISQSTQIDLGTIVDQLFNVLKRGEQKDKVCIAL
jgi:WD40 repeat protein